MRDDRKNIGQILRKFKKENNKYILLLDIRVTIHFILQKCEFFSNFNPSTVLFITLKMIKLMWLFFYLHFSMSNVLTLRKNLKYTLFRSVTLAVMLNTFCHQKISSSVFGFTVWMWMMSTYITLRNICGFHTEIVSDS